MNLVDLNKEKEEEEEEEEDEEEEFSSLVLGNRFKLAFPKESIGNSWNIDPGGGAPGLNCAERPHGVYSCFKGLQTNTGTHQPETHHDRNPLEAPTGPDFK